jgi:hypothetical protein
VLAGGVILVAWKLSLVPARFTRLENDARNIDDVQVAAGMSLRALPPTATVWAVDAGAMRYFGSARVVDMMGLNTPALLGAGAQPFLDAARPAFLEAAPPWSEFRAESGALTEFGVFSPSTPYTVSSFPVMAVHRLVRCTPGARHLRDPIAHVSFRVRSVTAAAFCRC